MKYYAYRYMRTYRKIRKSEESKNASMFVDTITDIGFFEGQLVKDLHAGAINSNEYERIFYKFCDLREKAINILRNW